jgi:hypothetical protein
MRPSSLSSVIVLAFGIVAVPCLAGQTKMAKKDIPPKVLQAFEKAYPGMQIQKQVMIMDGSTMLYKLEYAVKKVEHDVIINPEGTVVGNDENIAVSALPPAVVAACKTEFPKATIKEAEKITRGSVDTYGLDLVIGKDKVDAVFSADGKLTKKEEMEKNESGKGDKEEGEKEDGEKDEDGDK